MAESMLTTLADKIAPAHTALLVVDVQNDFCADDGAFGRLGCDLSAIQPMVPRLIQLIDAARAAGCLIVFIRGLYDEVYLAPNVVERRERRGSSRSICRSDSPGFAYYQVQPQPGDVEVFKHRYNAFIGTDLDLLLRSRGIQTIVMTGVATNVCVESTARHGYMVGYYVVFSADCTATNDLHLHQPTLENIERYFGTVHTADELEATWRPAAVPLRTGR
jgi:ureidoacrylate peracid hydrolase